MKYKILKQTFGSVLVELPPSRRTLMICNKPFFLSLPKIRFAIRFEKKKNTLKTSSTYVCCVNSKNKICHIGSIIGREGVYVLPNIFNAILCCKKIQANTVEELVENQILLFFNSKFTILDRFKHSNLSLYQDWQEETKRNINWVPDKFTMMSWGHSVEIHPAVFQEFTASTRTCLKNIDLDTEYFYFIESPNEKIQKHALCIMYYRNDERFYRTVRQLDELSLLSLNVQKYLIFMDLNVLSHLKKPSFEIQKYTIDKVNEIYKDSFYYLNWLDEMLSKNKFPNFRRDVKKILDTYNQEKNHA